MNHRLMTALGLAAAATFLMGPGSLRAQEEVRLSGIEMVESKNTIDHITQTDIERKTATNLWEAMKGTLGVYQQTSGGRNEGTLSIRGTSRYQVGLFIDDIPVATAYRNEWDANNALLYDLKSIEVSKGYSSPLLVSNNGLGGVINLRTAKPTKEIEFSARYLNTFDRELDDSGRLFAASIGTKQELFYLKTTVTQKQQDFFTLPSSYTPGSPSGRNEDGGRRENSDSKNKALNLLAGWTPTEDTDIMFGFVRQTMERGQPPNAAAGTAINATGGITGGPFSNSNPYNRYWRWPEYETTRYYMNGNVNLTEQAHLKAVLYNDAHKDTTNEFSNNTYSTRSAAGQSYDQYTRGGQLTFDYTFNPANKLAVSAGYRRLSHKSKREIGSAGRWFTDTEILEDYLDLGAEYTLKPIDPLTLVFGASETRATPKTIKDNLSGPYQATASNPFYGNGTSLDKSKSLFNYQVGAFYDLTENHELFATFAQKSRFATMRERYYNRSGAAKNPDLNPERALHYELGYRGLINEWLKINASVYQSEVKDMIYMISTNDGFENSDKTEFQGFELGTEAQFNKYLSAGLTFNYMEWENTTKSATSANLTQLPKFTSTAYGVVSPLEGLSIIPQVNYTSGFYWTSNPTVTTYKETGGFTTADLKAIYDYNEHLSFEAGAKNIFDKEYAYTPYYPEPGRSFFVGLTARY